MNVKVVDHLIINFKDFFSYQKKGDLDFIKKDIKHQICFEARHVIKKEKEIYGNKKKIEGERKKDIEVVKNMLLMGITDTDIISGVADLCLEDIQAVIVEVDKAVDLAKKMIGENADTSKISKATDLTIEHIEWMKKVIESGDESPKMVNINDIKWIKK